MAGGYIIESNVRLTRAWSLCYRVGVMSKTVFTVRLSDKAREILEKEALAQGVSRRDVVELALRDYELRRGKRNDRG